MNDCRLLACYFDFIEPSFVCTSSNSSEVFFCVADKTFSFQNLVWIEEVRLDPLTRHDVLASKRVSPI